VLLGVRLWVDLADGTADAVALIVAGSAVLGVVFAVINALRRRYVAAAVSLVVPAIGLALWALLRPRPQSICAGVGNRGWHRGWGGERR